jgi:hypothetical protein
MRMPGSLFPLFRPEDRMHSVRSFACFAVLALSSLSTGVSPAQQAGNPHDVTNWPPMNLTSNPVPDANRFLESSMQIKDNQKRIEALNLQRHKDMTSETAKLIVLAIQLKAETDIGSKEKVSVIDLRKAELIEKLAKSVRSKMAEEWNGN